MAEEAADFLKESPLPSAVTSTFAGKDFGDHDDQEMKCRKANIFFCVSHVFFFDKADDIANASPTVLAMSLAAGLLAFYA